MARAQAQGIILTADGARWIWNREADLARSLGLPPDKIVKVADFYHAVEHLTGVANLRGHGSGAVQSAIRRVVNLHLKGPSIFWRGKNDERMLHLHCYLKAGRWSELMLRLLYPSSRARTRQKQLRYAA